MAIRTRFAMCRLASPLGPGQRIELKDNELSYIRLNPRSYTPFGLGRLEVAFETIHEFLGAHRFAAKLASNSVVQYALWMQDLDPGQHERLIRWWQDDIEGTGRVPILTAENKPEVLRFGAGTDADLRLAWQEFLIRVIASAFDLPPLFLGVEADVNRSTAAGAVGSGLPHGGGADGKAAGRAHHAGCDCQAAGLERSGVCLPRSWMRRTRWSRRRSTRFCWAAGC